MARVQNTPAEIKCERMQFRDAHSSRIYRAPIVSSPGKALILNVVVGLRLRRDQKSQPVVIHFSTAWISTEIFKGIVVFFKFKYRIDDDKINI